VESSQFALIADAFEDVHHLDIDDELNPASRFPDCEMEDLQSTAGMIPIPLILNVLNPDDVLSDENKQAT
jgi:hypothetical protein